MTVNLRTEPKARGAARALVRRFIREKRLGVVGAVIVLLLLVFGIFSELLAPYGMDEKSLPDRFAAPSAQYLLGADQVGRDILSRLIYGARISLVVGLAATTVTVAVAMLIGVPSGYFGGRFDVITQRFVDAWMSFPELLVLLTVMSMVGRGQLQIILVIGIFTGVRWTRVVRGAVIGIKGNDYFEAARAVGQPHLGIIVRHILPNILAPLIVIFSVSLGWAILAEASLSFLGFGLPLDVPSWGGMLSGEGRRYLERKPALAMWPGICLTVVIYGVNVLGDALRDLLDPRLAGAARARSGATASE